MRMQHATTNISVPHAHALMFMHAVPASVPTIAQARGSRHQISVTEQSGHLMGRGLTHHACRARAFAFIEFDSHQLQLEKYSKRNTHSAYTYFSYVTF